MRRRPRPPLRCARMDQRLRERFLEDGALVAGVSSGTSADGIDVGIARFRASGTSRAPVLLAPELLAFDVVPFDEDLRARLRAVLDGAPCGLRETALLSRDLGRAFGAAARTVAARRGLALDLVGSHGQTVWHHDGAEVSGAATLQLGDGDFVAEEARCAVASDFRPRDVAAGGEGAPLSPLADDLVFARAPRPCAILNLGGLANVTWLSASGSGVLAFDTGPANSILDGLARRYLAADLDLGGAAAARGRCDDRVVESWLAHPFFARRAPKSTGRDTFGSSWLDGAVERARAFDVERGDDLIACAVELVARSVVEACDRELPSHPDELVVCGGGVRNPVLMRALERRFGVPAVPSSVHGVDPKAREALVFAVLGARCALGLPSTRTGATGAREGRVLGKWSHATSSG